MRTFVCCLLGLSVAVPAAFAVEDVNFTIEAGKVDRENSPIRIPLSLDQPIKGAAVEVTFADGTKVPGQITQSHLLAAKAEGKMQDVIAAELNFIAPKLEAGKSLTGRATFKEASSGAKVFAWKDTPGEFNDLSLGDRPVLRYMYAKLDESDKDKRHATMKVYHHVFDPQGKRLITKGPGGLFPHHRGLYYGFNKISYDGKTADTWHCNAGEWQSHEKFVSSEAGPVLGRHVIEVAWHGKKGDVFAKELRELTAYNTAGGILIEFASRLSSTGAEIKLDGDPQHAGFQFRASQDVPDKTAKQTYYLRPDGKGEPGKFRNWPGDKTHADLPWNALSIVLDDQRYTVCYLDRPENPKESRFSERDYGRFGSYFEAQVTPDKPLDLNYRVWVQEGEMNVDGVQRLDDHFTQPVGVTVKSLAK